LIPEICWKMKKTHTTISARLTPAVHCGFPPPCLLHLGELVCGLPASSSLTSMPSRPNAFAVSA
jgi:hypothetical protein